MRKIRASRLRESQSHPAKADMPPMNIYGRNSTSNKDEFNSSLDGWYAALTAAILPSKRYKKAIITAVINRFVSIYVQNRLIQ